MDTQKQPAPEAVSAVEPGTAGNNGAHGEFPALPGSFARVAPLIMGQHELLDLSELLLRLKRREL